MAKPQGQHSHVYVQRNEDPRLRERTVPMQVLSLGASRTGTMTIQAALEILGIPTWHWINQAQNLPDLAMWKDGLRAKWEPQQSGLKPFGRGDFDNLLGHWGGVTDQPPAFMAEEVVAAYPEAKVILHERDVDRWYESFKNTVIAGSDNAFVPLAQKIDPRFIGQMAQQTDLIAKHMFHVPVPRLRGPFALRNNQEFFEIWRRNAKAAYIAHNERVKRIVPREKLLLIKLEDGWGPLCEFLGKPVPDVPFPRVNETAALREMVNLYILEGYKRSLKRFLRRGVPVFVVLLAVLVWWVWS